MAEAGARLAIRLLQEAAERGEIEPWDIDVIAVIDGFLDQLRQRIAGPRLVLAGGGSFEHDLAQSSEAFLAASVLVALKAEVLEADTFPPEPALDQAFDPEECDLDWASAQALQLPRRPERHLWRRPVAPPPLQRPVTLGELIRQLEDIAERLEQEEGRERQRSRQRRFSDRAAIAQVCGLAHREKLPETTAALSLFLVRWSGSPEGQWLDFEELVRTWAAQESGADPGGVDLDRDRVGVFWALLFLSAQGKVELAQEGGLYGPLRLKRLGADQAGRLTSGQGSAGGPARELLAA